MMLGPAPPSTEGSPIQRLPSPLFGTAMDVTQDLMGNGFKSIPEGIAKTIQFKLKAGIVGTPIKTAHGDGYAFFDHYMGWRIANIFVDDEFLVLDVLWRSGGKEIQRDWLRPDSYMIIEYVPLGNPDEYEWHIKQFIKSVNKLFKNRRQYHSG